MHIVYCIAPSGGPESYIKTLLPWLERKGHRVSIVYMVPYRQQNPFPKHVQVLYAPPGDAHYYLGRMVGSFKHWSRQLRAFEQMQALYTAIRTIDVKHPVDIVEVIEGIPIGMLRKHWKVVVRGHGSDWTFRHFCQDGFRKYDHKFVRMEASQLRKAHAVSTISEHLADHLSEFCHYPRERIYTIPYSLDLDIFSPSRTTQSLPELAVMAVGRLEHRKGTDLLLKAMLTVWRSFPATKVYLLGSEAEFTRYQLLDMIPLEMRDRVVFPGFISHDSLPDFYRRVTVYVAPTQYETLGYTVLEAMACGVPVITSRVGALPELVNDGVNGYLVPFGEVETLANAILKMLDQPKMQKSMAEAARKTALAYAPDIINNRLETLYKNLLDGTLVEVQ